MGLSYSFRNNPNSGYVELVERAFDGVGRADHTVITSFQHTPGLHGLLESLKAAIQFKEEFDEKKNEARIEALKKEIEQKRSELESLEKSLIAQSRMTKNAVLPSNNQ